MNNPSEKISIAIIEDEILFQKQLSAGLAAYFNHSSVHAELMCFKSGSDFLQSKSREKFQVIFLDVHMQGLNGIETAQRIREKDKTCMIIFCTSSSDYMPNAFQFHAFDYIMKPVDPERLRQVMDDALAHLPKTSKYVTIENNGQRISLLHSSIVAVTTNRHYLNIETNQEQQYTIRQTLSQFIELLDHDPRFLLVNRGILVNMDYIRTMENTECTLTDGRILPIRVRDNYTIIQEWHNYCFEKVKTDGQV